MVTCLALPLFSVKPSQEDRILDKRQLSRESGLRDENTENRFWGLDRKCLVWSGNTNLRHRPLARGVRLWPLLVDLSNQTLDWDFIIMAVGTIKRIWAEGWHMREQSNISIRGNCQEESVRYRTEQRASLMPLARFPCDSHQISQDSVLKLLSLSMSSPTSLLVTVSPAPTTAA